MAEQKRFEKKTLDSDEHKPVEKGAKTLKIVCVIAGAGTFLYHNRNTIKNTIKTVFKIIKKV